ncbi:MAG: sulfotransferase family protein [Armatimonadota bacterium]
MTHVLDALHPVFIVGTDKSGTSLLFSLFDAHPAVTTLFETFVYNFTPPDHAARDDLVEAIRGRFAGQFWRTHEGFHREGVTQGRFLAAVDRFMSADAGASIQKSLLYAFLDSVLEGPGRERSRHVTHFVEKTPLHYRHAARIFADFPTAKVIHVLRDPRDNYLALKRRVRDRTSSQYTRPQYHPAAFVNDSLLASLDGACENVARFDGQYRILFYEDLVFLGERIVREVAAWLGLPWHDMLLTPSIAGEVWGGNSTAPDLRGRLKPFDPRPIGRWRAELSPREITLTEAIIESYRLQSKYPVTRSHGRLDRLLGIVLPFQDELRREYSSRHAGQALPSFAAGLGWRYVRRRLAIYASLQRRAGADDRLIQASFAPVAGG